MKARIAALMAAGTIAIGAGAATAAAIDFDVNVANSEVDLLSPTTNTGVFFVDLANAGVCDVSNCGVDAELHPTFATPEIFQLEEGMTQVIPFLTLTPTGIGGVDLFITATLAFDLPGAATTTGSGDGSAILLDGILTAGSLTWNDLPSAVTLANGSVVTIDFQDLTGVDFLNKNAPYTVNAYVTATSVVPLPAAAWMLVAGLGGLAVMKRRKKTAA